MARRAVRRRRRSFPNLVATFSQTLHFDEKTPDAVRTRISEKNGKPDVQGLVRQKDLLRQAHAARHEAQVLLEKAQRAVEVAIEDGEAAGMAFLK